MGIPPGGLLLASTGGSIFVSANGLRPQTAMASGHAAMHGAVPKVFIRQHPLVRSATVNVSLAYLTEYQLVYLDSDHRLYATSPSPAKRCKCFAANPPLGCQTHRSTAIKYLRRWKPLLTCRTSNSRSIRRTLRWLLSPSPGYLRNLA